LETSDVRILLVEDFIPYRTFVGSLLSETPGLRVIGEASDGLEAVEKAQQLKPDVILMDIGLPVLNGLDATRRIRELVPSSKIVFLTMEASVEVAEEALSRGACGYIVKDQAGSELLEGLAAVLRGERFISRCLSDNGFTPKNGKHAAA